MVEPKPLKCNVKMLKGKYSRTLTRIAEVAVMGVLFFVSYGIITIAAVGAVLYEFGQIFAPILAYAATPGSGSDPIVGFQLCGIMLGALIIIYYGGIIVGTLLAAL